MRNHFSAARENNTFTGLFSRATRGLARPEAQQAAHIVQPALPAGSVAPHGVNFV
jgi:hypothetical protein